MDFGIINIKTVATEKNGALSYFEGGRDIPFAIKRVYYIYGVPCDAKRGGHAHKQLQQFLFCPHGKIQIKLDDGMSKAEIMLDSEQKGLFIGPRLWRDMIWIQTDSVLCVMASEFYDEDDYIRDYNAFIDFIHTRRF